MFLTIVEALPAPCGVIAEAVSLKIRGLALKLVREVHSPLLVCRRSTAHTAAILELASSFVFSAETIECFFLCCVLC